MKQVDITLIRAELSSWPDKKTGEIIEMTKIYYVVQMSNTDKNIGGSILVCHRRGNHLEKLKPYVSRKVLANVREDATENGSKWVITKIDNKDL